MTARAHSRLSLACRQLIDSGWLLALVLAVLFFNPLSERVFEPDRSALVCGFAWLMLLAWLLARIERGDWQSQLSRLGPTSGLGPLSLALLALTAVLLLSTLLSVHPALSFFGSQDRAQGSLQSLALVVIVLMLLSHSSSAIQGRTAVSLLIGLSLPVVIYAGLQRLGLDPIVWQQDVTRRASAQMGNPIFLAAWLGMVLPLTLVRLIEVGRAGRWQMAVLYGLLLLLQFGGLWLSGSRGPMLALLPALSLMAALLLPAWLGWRPQRLAIVGSLLLLPALLVLIALLALRAPLESDAPSLTDRADRASQPLGRVAALFEARDANARVRVLSWQSTLDRWLSSEPLVWPDGSADRLARIRPLIGYGPDTLGIISSSTYPPELGTLEPRDRLIDRAHNDSLDQLVMTGLIGFLAWQALFLVALGLGLRGLGLLADRAAVFQLVGLWLGGGLLLGLGLALWRGPAWLAPGFPLGNLVGLMVFALLQGRRAQHPMILNARNLTLIGLLGTIAAHYAEIQFGIAVLPTRLTALIAMALTASLAASTAAGAAAVESATRPASPRKPGLEWGFLLLAITGTLAYSFLVLAPEAGAEPFAATPWSFHAFALAMVLLWLGFALISSAGRQPLAAIRRPTVLALLLLLPLSLLMIDRHALRPVQADMQLKRAQVLSTLAEREERSDQAAAHRARAIALSEDAGRRSPRSDSPWLIQGRLWMNQAEQVADHEQRLLSFEQAERALSQARALNPLMLDHSVNLGRLHARWSKQMAEHQRMDHLRASERHYHAAMVLAPRHATLQTEHALIRLHHHADCPGALDGLESAAAIDAWYAAPRFQLVETLIQCQPRLSPERRAGLEGDLWRWAEEGERLALSWPGRPEEALLLRIPATWLQLMQFLQQTGQWRQALNALDRAAAQGGQHFPEWAQRYQRALLLLQAGERGQARAEALAASRLAPADRQPHLGQLLQLIGNPDDRPREED